MAHFFKKNQKSAVVATVTSVNDLKFLKNTQKTKLDEIADGFEFRLDDFFPNDLDALESVLSDFDRPVLLTPRHPAEGGNAPEFSDPGVRIEVLERFGKWADLIDLEIDFGGPVLEAISATCPVLGSHHNFLGAISMAEIETKIAQAGDLGFSFSKFAMVIDELETLGELVALVEKSGPISAMGMGDLGKLSRLVLAKAGSCLNYGYLTKPNAPGQWSARELKRLIDEI